MVSGRSDKDGFSSSGFFLYFKIFHKNALKLLKTGKLLLANDPFLSYTPTYQLGRA